MTEANITVYGAPWCPDCTRAKQFLGEQRVRYNWIDIDRNEDARAYVQQVNDGKQIIPTIIFEDGSLLVEPSNAELAAKLGIQPKARRDFYDLIVVGGGPAGLSTALYTAREGIETLVVESSAIGGQAGVTERIDNYLGFPEGVGGGASPTTCALTRSDSAPRCCRLRRSQKYARTAATAPLSPSRAMSTARWRCFSPWERAIAG